MYHEQRPVRFRYSIVCLQRRFIRVFWWAACDYETITATLVYQELYALWYKIFLFL